MGWKSFHSRGETLRSVIDPANDRRDGVLPTDVPGVSEHFTDELDLIGALLLKWHARLSGNIERALVREPMDLESAVASAWRATAEQMPGVRLVIDQCVEHPTGPEMQRAMARASEGEWARMAIAAGLANAKNDAAVAVGRAVEERARLALAESWVAPVPSGEVRVHESAQEESPGQAHAGVSLADRIRAVLAA